MYVCIEEPGLWATACRLYDAWRDTAGTSVYEPLFFSRHRVATHRHLVQHNQLVVAAKSVSQQWNKMITISCQPRSTTAEISCDILRRNGLGLSSSASFSLLFCNNNFIIVFANARATLFKKHDLLDWKINYCIHCFIFWNSGDNYYYCTVLTVSFVHSFLN